MKILFSEDRHDIILYENLIQKEEDNERAAKRNDPGTSRRGIKTGRNEGFG